VSKTKVVVVNERGRRIGESHPRAKLTDHEIDLIRELVEELVAGGMKVMEAYRVAAEKFEIHARTAQQIALCMQRAELPARAKRIR
jgi:hypothetical protein